MDLLTIKAPPQEPIQLTAYWEQYFVETPMCSCEACCHVAVEVDPFFPYLDDLNRCDAHRVAEEVPGYFA